jgi:hypothetical protein
MCFTRALDIITLKNVYMHVYTLSNHEIKENRSLLNIKRIRYIIKGNLTIDFLNLIFISFSFLVFIFFYLLILGFL